MIFRRKARPVRLLEEVLSSRRKLILVTGRLLDDLLHIFPQAELFDRIVAENGAVLYNPHTKQEDLLAPAPPASFRQALAKRKVQPLSFGKAIVATSEPQHQAVLDAIHELGLELQVIFNKSSVMVLPSGINKGSGLKAACRGLGLSVHNVVGFGDAENDHALLGMCEFSVAVANAVASIKEKADLVTKGRDGFGVGEVLRELISTDLEQYQQRLTRHHILLGRDDSGHECRIAPYSTSLLVAGPSGSGKSTAVAALLERLAEKKYQFCLIDPEGDYEGLEYGVNIGDAQRPPSAESVLQLLEKFENPMVGLLGVPIEDRPGFATQLLHKIYSYQAHTGRPHWLILDEAHHLMPASWRADPDALPQKFGSSILITVHPEELAPIAMKGVNIVMAVGASPQKTFASVANVIAEQPPAPPLSANLESSDVLLWFVHQKRAALHVRVEPAKAERLRHRRKYAEGDIQEKSFYFRGPKGKLNLRAQNLALFVQIADGVDDETWMHHLRQGDYSRWIRTAIEEDYTGAA